MEPVIMFDFDGVVADSLDVFFAEFTGVCAGMGFDRINSREAFLALFETNLLEGLVRAGFPVWKLKKLARAFAPRIAEANRRVEPFPGMPEIVRTLAARHPLYFITSNASAAIEAFVKTHAIAGVRDVLGADKEPSKVKKIKQVRKLHPEHTPYYIGDTKGDMVEARRAGAVAVGAAWGWHPVETLAAGMPDHLLRRPEELLALFRTT
jgi:phosphoglycolate phosphatase